MFAYIDPSVKAELQKRGTLFYLDETGAACDAGSRAAPFLSVIGPIPLPLALPDGELVVDWYPWVRNADLTRIEDIVQTVRQDGPKGLYSLLSDFMAVNSVLLYGDFRHATCPLVRIHSNCLTGDVFGSMRCDCGPQLVAALQAIGREGVGAVLYMAGHEGRGIGLWAKAITYLLQDAGHDTYAANEKLGFPADSRDFGDAARLIRYFRGPNARLRLLGNNPLKREALTHAGIQVEAQTPLVTGITRFNARYLNSKREHGHLIPDGLLPPVKPL